MVGKRLYGVADAGDFRVGFRVLRHESLQRGAVNGRHASASPALAGMYLRYARDFPRSPSFPRTRGDVPIHGRAYCTGGVAGGMCNPQRILRVVTGTLRVKLALEYVHAPTSPRLACPKDFR